MTNYLSFRLEFTIDEDDDPRNINIPKFEGSHIVVGPMLECPEITEKLKIKKIKKDPLPICTQLDWTA